MRPEDAVAAGMVEIAAGTIELRDEGTRRRWTVELRPFSLAAYPLTRGLHAAIVGQDAAGPLATPVTEVSWFDALRLCNALSRRAGFEPCYALGDDPQGWEVTCAWEASGYRLPTEAEWEYACRAGTSEVRYGALDAIAWHRGNSGGRAREVGTRAPNPWGLHDMIGNVWEWCWDLFDPKVYGPYRVFRGGGWNDEPRGCRASCRRKSHPTFRIDDLGLRLARSR